MSNAKAKTWAGYIHPDDWAQVRELHIEAIYVEGSSISIPVTVVPTPRWEAMVECVEKCERALDLRRQFEADRHPHATLDPWTVVRAENEARAALARVDAQEESDG